MRHITLNGAERDLISIQAFREQHDLANTFGVALFEPKDFTGLGSIERAGTALNRVQRNMLHTLPQSMPLNGWLAFLPSYQQRFEDELLSINEVVGLRDMEIDFAVNGFADVCQAVVYEMVRAHAERREFAGFAAVYHSWLESTVRVSTTTHTYTHNGDTWRVNILNDAYGRMGLVVQADTWETYILDSVYACPAAGFMHGLLKEITTRMVTATT